MSVVTVGISFFSERDSSFALAQATKSNACIRPVFAVAYWIRFVDKSFYSGISTDKSKLDLNTAWFQDFVRTLSFCHGYDKSLG